MGRQYHSLVPFTQQGLEKKNDVITKTYFWSSNHQGEAALWQIVEKQNRVEHMETLGIKKVKVHDIQCSNCDGIAHNRLTCQKACKYCSFVPYSDHLVRSDCDKKKIASCQKEN